MTGNPQHDYIHSGTNIFDRDRICKELGIDPAGTVILIATGALQSKCGYPDHDRLLLESVYRVGLCRPELKLVVKLHPTEDGELERMIASEMGLDEVLTVKERLQELL